MSEQITHLQIEQQIRNILARGEEEKGKLLLKKMVAEMARLRRFENAERLRDLLVEIDPMALGDIIRAAEIIEKEKFAAIDKNHLTTWSALRDVLEPVEFSTLYHSLVHQRFAKGEVIVKQGSQHSVLYFVNSGRVELFFQQNGRDVLVKTIGPGEIFGAGTFFEASVWTINARSLGAEVSSLTQEKTQRWQKDFPGLESKLNDFCSKYKIIYEYFGIMGRDRRAFERLGITGKVDMALFDREGKDTGIGAKGDLFDISAGGVSFFLRISKKSNARLLFRRNVGLTMASTLGSRFSITGMVLAVRSQPVVGNEYATSIRFSRVLAKKELRELITSTQERARK
jgi:hypothetical protein